MQIELTSRGLLSIFFRHKFKLLLPLLVCSLLGFAYIKLTQPAYESNGTLLVKFGRAALADVVETRSMPSEITQNDRREMMQSFAQIITSRDLLRSLVKEYGVERLYPGLMTNLRPNDNPIEVAVNRLQGADLSAKTAYNSDLIEVKLFNTDAALAADFLNKLFDQFIMLQSDVYNKQQTDFLAAQTTQAAEKLAQSQAALRAYKETISISSLDEEQKRLLEQKMNAATIALTAMDKAKERLEELEAEETALLATYQPDSPAVKKIRQSIARAREQVIERQNDLHQQQDKAESNHVGTQSLISGEVSRVERRIDILEAARTRLQDLERQVALDEENYKNFMMRSETARVNATLNAQKITRITVLETPVIATSPTRPRKLVTLLMAILAGLVLGLGAAIITETLDDRFSTPAQVRQSLQLPVLASFFVPSGGQ